MRSPRPCCPNAECAYHQVPPAGFYRKRGYYRPRHNRQPVPRYECRGCGAWFSSSQAKPTRGQHRPELNRKVLELAVSGVTMRRMAEVLGCSQSTVERKVAHLAAQAKAHHIKHLTTLSTRYAMFDELETFIHARWKQVSVSVVVRVKTGEVLAFGVARKPSSMRQGIEGNRWVINDRPQVIPRVLSEAAIGMKAGATLASDGDANYGKWVAQTLPGITHAKLRSPTVPEYDPLFAINLAFAKMRNDLARLGRKTWTTTKTLKGLENHLWLWVAWTNDYQLR